MSRIIAGTLKGRRLVTPRGTRTRPTSERVREALFSSLAPGGNLEGLHVADLFAGSGAVGIEACSRGATRALFVEAHAPTAQLLRRNLSDLGIRQGVEVLTASVNSVVAKSATEQYDIVFADPPYELGEDQLGQILHDLAANGWLAEGADLVIERSGKSPEPAWPDVVGKSRSRRYGSSTLWYGLVT
ncbi:16S rRNA (guanine(966)-N(2))-methyltransferase RsmD [Natronoglycomyces albus]|uniref:16S rRNA (Guanine(966)-N(2))-methyltransferase RsmD n=1 Tax=Natronoglycomyces albus TaxID=2811108 RepID=A0A895XSH7_9ACTN|nr:16S rRNA (guanine(966)-N(2))-methyltransferase RsmD [Natronoglycomyces albus]QSB06185.1 16S rRNA (guanine(966)-N(2))-methyltransferase RsmD [Natronoglycomyces albus]